MEAFPQNIGGLIGESKNEKKSEKRLWDLSLKFVEGRQWLSYDKRVSQFITANLQADGQSRVTVNLLINIYRNVLSRLALSYPSIAVMPATPSAEDILKAKTSEMALQYYWHRDDMKHKLEKLIQWLLTTGTAATHTFYDSSEKRILTEVYGAYDIFFERAVISPEDSRWIALRTYTTKYELKKAYPDHAKEIDQTSMSDEDNYGLISSGTTNEPPKDRVELFEIYWRDGRHAIVVGGTYLHKGKWSTKTYPVNIYRYTEVPRRLWGISMLAPALDLQMLYNRARSQVIHNVELMGNPKWLIPKTAGINTHALTSKPGEKVFYNPAGGAPQQVAAAPLPGYMLDNISRIQSEMMDTIGIHSVTLGKRAVGVTSGKAMTTLSEKDTSQLQITQEGVERGVTKVGKVVLELMKRHYTEDRMMRTLDQYGQVAFNALKNTDIIDEPDIFLQAGSLFRDEAQDRDAKVMQLLEMKLIEPEAALQELSFRTGNKNVSEKAQSISHATDMLDAVRMGGEIEIFSSDDIKTFKEVFSEFMRTTEFYEMPPPTQEYLRDALVAIATASAPNEDYENLLAANKVFPRGTSDPDPAAIAKQMMAPGSQSAQSQVAQEQAARAQQTGSMASAERSMTRGSEAGMSNMRQGGGIL